MTDAMSATESAIENENLHSFNDYPFWGLLGMNYKTSSGKWGFDDYNAAGTEGVAEIEEESTDDFENDDGAI